MVNNSHYSSQAFYHSRFFSKSAPSSTATTTASSADDLKDKKVCITGTLTFMSRDKAFRLVKKAGGLPTSYITMDTDYLVVGKPQRIGNLNGRMSNKEKQALVYRDKGSGIKLIEEKLFYVMLL